VIGVDGGMPWHLSEDLKHFKRTTLGGTMIMGRKTFDSIGRPLPGRRTIVVTRDPSWSHEGVDVAHTLDDAFALAAHPAGGAVDADAAASGAVPDAPPAVFVVGGGEIYAQSLDAADRLVLTEVAEAPEGDTFFPEWSRTRFTETAREQHDGFAFVTWDRVRPSS
jgi:dihydrofolate reductase